jgi:pimeloyl-ACP methyl ester carboxylesterase
VDDTLPEVRYARSGDVHIAYQVLGEGEVDLVFVMGWITNLETYWELPAYRRFMQRLAGFTRLILFDKRGMGLSDRTLIGTLEERMDDVRAVMDAVGSERAVLLGVSEGAPMSMVFAATHPERTAGLIFVGGEVKEIIEDDWPWGQSSRDDYEAMLAQTLEGFWGKPTRVWFAPSVENDPVAISWLSRLERSAASPASAVAFMRLGSEIDVRHVAPSIHVPTLVLHTPEDPVVRYEQARWLAEQIPGARLVELKGRDHVPWFDVADEVITEVRDFLTGFREAPEPENVLATVLFTDIVGSTDRARELGDSQWTALLEQHHATVRGVLNQYRGREIDTTGDGFLAAFDGPARGIRCAQAIIEALGRIGIQARAGLHTGEVEMVGEKIAGIAVHIGARVAAVAGAGEVLVSPHRARSRRRLGDCLRGPRPARAQGARRAAPALRRALLGLSADDAFGSCGSPAAVRILERRDRSPLLLRTLRIRIAGLAAHRFGCGAYGCQRREPGDFEPQAGARPFGARPD